MANHRVRATAPPSPSAPLRLVAALVATLPFWFNESARDLLVPLYSSAPVHALQANAVFYTLVSAAFAALLCLRREGSPPIDWRVRWLAVGTYKVVTEGLLRWRDGWLFTRFTAPSTGVWAGRVVLEFIPTLCVWLWLNDSYTCKERSAFLPRFFLPLAYLGSLLPAVSSCLRSRMPVLPECHILQAHGLLLCAVALAAPRTYAPRRPRSRTTSSTFVDRLSTQPLACLALFAAVVSLAHLTARASSHCPSSRPALPRGVLAAQKSVTGWVVVGEDTLPGGVGGAPHGGDYTFRYLRADHSLLGGLWIGPSRDQLRMRGAKVDEAEVVRRAESIYSTFILQELVRLVPAPEDLPRQTPEQGLIIGLGAGLSARALAQHGINLTIVEIDPVVYAYARDYFGVSDVSAGEVVLQDAVKWVAEQEGSGKLFDYIVHDVFTGGAVPAALFTLPFLTRLAALLHPSGVLALNFAGTLSSPSSRAILRTILAAFTLPPSSGACRAIEDVPQTAAAGPQHPGAGTDAFRNVVVFCSRSWFVPVAFRAPSRADLLAFPSAGIRRAVFAAFRGHEIDLAPFMPSREGAGEEVGGRLVRGEEDARWVAREQLADVRRHWDAMRGVLPAEVWARW
ncbi:hypothetical protein JCM3770_003780 [Rhodotorula araucariae]